MPYGFPKYFFRLSLGVVNFDVANKLVDDEPLVKPFTKRPAKGET